MRKNELALWSTAKESREHRGFGSLRLAVDRAFNFAFSTD
jgi:hypothetical protein